MVKSVLQSKHYWLVGHWVDSDGRTVQSTTTAVRLESFQEYECFALPHVIHMTTAGISLVLFTLVALVMVVGVVEQCPLVDNPAAQRNASLELHTLVLKTLLAMVTTLLTPYKKVQGVMVQFHQLPYV